MDWFCALGVAPSFQRGLHKVCQQLHCLRLLHQSGLEGGFGGTCGICFAASLSETGFCAGSFAAFASVCCWLPPKRLTMARVKALPARAGGETCCGTSGRPSPASRLATMEKPSVIAHSKVEPRADWKERLTACSKLLPRLFA